MKLLLVLVLVPHAIIGCMQTAEPGTTIAPPTTEVPEVTTTVASTTNTVSSSTTAPVSSTSTPVTTTQSTSSTTSTGSTSTASKSTSTSTSTTTSTASTTTTVAGTMPCGACFASSITLLDETEGNAIKLQPVPSCESPGQLKITCAATGGNMAFMEINPEKLVLNTPAPTLTVSVTCSGGKWIYGGTLTVTEVACSQF